MLKEKLRKEKEAAAKDELTSRDKFIEYLETADIALIRSDYLIQLYSEGRHMQRRQDIDPSAIVPKDEMKERVKNGSIYDTKHIVRSVSHAWLSKDHPDPGNSQLEALVMYGGGDHTSRHQRLEEGLMLFYDYMSLYQKPRTENENKTFATSLNRMHMLYAHDDTYVLRIEAVAEYANHGASLAVFDDSQNQFVHKTPDMFTKNLTPYMERGWCMAECLWSATKRRADFTWTVGQSVTRKTKAPLPPRVFESRVESQQLKFTSKSDMNKVTDLQKRVFEEKAERATNLRLNNLDVTEFEILLEALPLFKVLRVLDLSSSSSIFTATGSVRKLLQVLAVHPTLEYLVLVNCDITGSEAIRQLDDFSEKHPSFLYVLDHDNSRANEEIRKLSQLVQDTKS